MPAKVLTLQFLTTFAIFLSSAGGAIFVNARAKKPRDSLTPPLVEPTTLLVVLLVVGLLSMIHVLNLLGLHK